MRLSCLEFVVMMNRFSSEYFPSVRGEGTKTAVCNATIASYMGVQVEACHDGLFSNLLR